MTPEQWARHNLTHLPYHPACPFCIAGKRNNTPHRHSTTDRKLPLLHSDYGFLRDNLADDLSPFLGVYVKPWKLYWAIPVDIKGPEPKLVSKLAQVIRFIGLTHFVHRNDKEPALRALIWDATKLAGMRMNFIDNDGNELTEEQSKKLMDETRAIVKKNGTHLPPLPSHPIVAVPEESHPGESKSNGAIEMAIQRIEDQARTLKLALESRLGMRIPMHHPLMAWLLQHAATLLTHYDEDNNCTTAYDRLHGATMRDKICEFGETVMYYIPKRNRKQMDPRWQFGAFIGRAWGSNQNFIAKKDGTVTRARAMVRVVESKRWQPKRLQNIHITPLHEAPNRDDLIEDSPEPHSNAAAAIDHTTEMGDSLLKAPRRIKITLDDVKRLGYTECCPKMQPLSFSTISPSSECPSFRSVPAEDL